jgi:hypothetical protein
MPGSPNFRMTFKRGCAQEPEGGSSDTRFLAALEIALSPTGRGELVAMPCPTATSPRWGEA